jgi:hypothetical protein
MPAVDPAFSGNERIVIVNSLALRRQSLIRARAKEVPGSDLYGFRTKEIEAVDALMRRFA